MIIHKVGDLLSSTEVNVLVHQANLFHTFGGGIALAIRTKFPEAYDADLATPYGEPAKLGTLSIAKIANNKYSTIKFICNMYSQTGLGGQDRQTSYDSMQVALSTLRSKLDARVAAGKTTALGIPYKLGSGLANGDFNIVMAIIQSVFGDAKFDVIIYYLPEFAHCIPNINSI